jgi:hypothetical protein
VTVTATATDLVMHHPTTANAFALQLCNGYYALQLSYSHAPELSHAYIQLSDGSGYSDAAMRPMDLAMQPN